MKLKKAAILLSIVVVPLALYAIYNFASQGNKSSAIMDAPPAFAGDNTKKSDHTITAYYLHGDFRCRTCLNLEKYSKEAVKGIKQLKGGMNISFEAVNIDKKENERFMRDYNAGRGLLIVDTPKGKQTRWKMLDNIWNLSHDRDALIKYIQREITLFIEGK